MKLLCGQQRKAVSQVEPHLVPEGTQRSGPRTVIFPDPVFQGMIEQFEILLHN
jgi:hypothetical protein